MKDIQHTLLLAAGFLVLFAVAEILYHVLKIRAELTRKFVHVCSGLITLLFPLYIENHWFILALCGSFALILLASMQFGLLKSINNVNRDTWGSIAFPAAVYGCYLVFDFTGSLLFFYLPILIMAFADPAAALVGKRWPKGIYKIGSERKSLTGTSAFFIIAFIISFTLLYFDGILSFENVIIASLIIAFFTAFTEGISRKGLDNFTIPAAALLVLYIYFF